MPDEQQLHVAIIGTRTPTAYGERYAYQLAGTLAKLGAVIVSGLAIGVDAIAHKAAIEVGGKTIGVLGSGHQFLHPPSNQRLADQIMNGYGAIVSEYDYATPAAAYRFPARNRIVAGLADVVLVIEAGEKSGTLITTNIANSLGRHVLAVPGSLDMSMSSGANNLIRSGAAKLLTDVSDVLELLPTVQQSLLQKPKPGAHLTNQLDKQLVELIDGGTIRTDDLVEAVEVGASETAVALSRLEISGIIRNIGAGQWVVKN